MEMTFGRAHDIWGRVLSSDKTLLEDEVREASQWFNEFNSKLSDKLSQSEEALQDALLTKKDNDIIKKKQIAVEADKRQVDDFISKYDDLINWLNSHK